MIIDTIYIQVRALILIACTWRMNSCVAYYSLLVSGAEFVFRLPVKHASTRHLPTEMKSPKDVACRTQFGQ